jgi:hypothetical protein
MTKRSLPPVTDLKENLAGSNVLPLDSYAVVEWHPAPDGQGKPTQVHLVLNIPDLPVRFSLRLKSASAVDTLVGSLMRHRKSVWPEMDS